MAFTITVDGDYSSPVLLKRIPKNADFPDHKHFIWEETWIVLKSAYYPLQIGAAHPDAKEDPYDPALTSAAASIFELTSGGNGQPLYLINEEVLGFAGTLVIFIREYSSVPIDWTETEYGFYTFPGYRYYSTIYEKPANLPVLMENAYTYTLGYPENLDDYDTKNYKITVQPNGTSTEVNWIEYYGRFADESGTYVEAESILSKKTGDAPYIWPADLNDTPVIDVEVERWRGEIFQVKVRSVKQKV